MTKIAVVLPAYNEEATVGACIKAFHDALPEAEIFVVDNRSTDQTASVARLALAKEGAVGKVLEESNPGKGNAVRRAFAEIDADTYILVDADMTYPAHRVRDLLEPVEDGRADMAVGDRHTGGDYQRENTRPLHNFGNRLVQWLINRLFSASLVDIMSGYRVLSRRFVKNYPIMVEGFQLETDMTLHALHKRFRVVEVPVEYLDRPAGSVSKLSTFSDGARVLFTIAQIFRYYRPLAFFGSLALLFFVAGFLSAIPVFQDWFESGYIYHVPLAILASALEIAAIVMLGVALILDAISHRDRMEYELRLLTYTGASGHGKSAR